MSIINRFLTVVTEPEFKLARDLTAMTIADGALTPEEKEAISAICHIEGIDQRKLLENLTGKGEPVAEEIPQTRRSKEGRCIFSRLSLAGRLGLPRPSVRTRF